MEIKITNEVKQILNNYNEKDLLSRAIATEPNQKALNIYAEKVKPKHPYNIDEKTINLIQHFNLSAPIALVFNFLIETCCDCSKVHTKRIAHALNCYYNALNNDKKLFSQILNEYADSIFYNEEIGLSEEDIAHFLTTSNERSKIN